MFVAIEKSIMMSLMVAAITLTVGGVTWAGKKVVDATVWTAAQVQR